MPQHAQPNSFTSENLLSYLSKIQVSLRPSSVFGKSSSVQSYPKFTDFKGDQKSVSFLSANNPTDLPFFTLEKTSRPSTLDLYLDPLRLDKRVINHPRQDLRNQILPINRKNNNLQNSAIICNRELTTLTYTSTELKFEVTVNFIGLNPQTIPTSTQVKHRTFASLFDVTSLQFTSNDELSFGHQWESITFYNPISGLK